MAWFECHEQVRDELKIHRLAVMAGVRYAEALGWCIAMWAWATGHQRNGDLSSLSKDELQHICACEITQLDLKNLLHECGLLNKHWHINKWKEHGIKYLEGSRKRQEDYRKQGWRDPLGWAAIRVDVLRRDNFSCGYCGKKATTVDHVVPVSKGGSHELENLVACCKSCNQKKNNKSLEKCGMGLRNTIVTPSLHNNSHTNPTNPTNQKDINTGAAAPKVSKPPKRPDPYEQPVRQFMAYLAHKLAKCTGAPQPQAVRRVFGLVIAYLKDHPEQIPELSAEIDRLPVTFENGKVPSAEWYVSAITGVMNRRKHEARKLTEARPLASTVANVTTFGQSP